MDCDRIERLLGAYLDGELGVDEVATVDAHLATCAACASRLETLRALRSSIRGLLPEPSDAGLDEVLARILEGEAPHGVPRAQAPPRLPRARAWIGGIAAGVVLLLAVAFWLVRLERESAPERHRPVPRPPVASPAPSQPIDAQSLACLRPEDCGSSARPLWPALPI